MFLLLFVSLLGSILALTAALTVANAKSRDTALLTAKLVNVKVGGLDPENPKDLSKAFIYHAELENGTVLNEDQLDYIQDNSDISMYFDSK